LKPLRGAFRGGLNFCFVKTIFTGMFCAGNMEASHALLSPKRGKGWREGGGNNYPEGGFQQSNAILMSRFFCIPRMFI